MYSRDNKDMKTSILKLPEMALPPIIQTGSKGAHLVTDLALDLQNEYGKLDDSRKLFKMLQEEFAESTKSRLSWLSALMR